MSSKNYMLILLFCMGHSYAQSRYISGCQEIVLKESLSYYLYFPKNYDQKVTEQFPILLFLHGGGEAGTQGKKGFVAKPPKLIEEGKEFPFLILAPHNSYAKKWWNTRAIIQLLDTIVKKYRVDTKQIYLSGLSRGGSATWEMVVQYPKKFAALAVVSGMAPAPYASWIDKELPIWVFHGEEDKVIPISESEEMVKKLRATGHQVKYTTYKGVGHNAWDRAYTDPELYTWLIKQRLK